MKRKLALKRSVVRNLSAAQLANAAGGTSHYSLLQETVVSCPEPQPPIIGRNNDTTTGTSGTSYFGFYW